MTSTVSCEQAYPSRSRFLVPLVTWKPHARVATSISCSLLPWPGCFLIFYDSVGLIVALCWPRNRKWACRLSLVYLCYLLSLSIPHCGSFQLGLVKSRMYCQLYTVFLSVCYVSIIFARVVN